MQQVITYKIDLYTQVILTIIAITLCAICIGMFFRPAEANAAPSVIDVNLKSINGFNINAGELPVNIEEVDGRSISKIPVNIESLGGSSIYNNQLNVNIERINGSSISGSELPVKIR